MPKPSEIAECGPGWRAILEALDEVFGISEQVKVVQVKEKFGGLRVYYDSSDGQQTEIEAAVAALAAVAFKTCEDCGRYGSMRSPNGWMRVMCDGCADA